MDWYRITGAWLQCELSRNGRRRPRCPDRLSNGLVQRNARLKMLDIHFIPAEWWDWPESLTDFNYVIRTDISYERSLHGVLRDFLTS